MKILNLICCALALVGFTSCGASTDKKTPETCVEQKSETEDRFTDDSENTNLINTVYEKFVFAIDSVDEIVPETYFTDNALQKLQEDYDFDCDEGPCYAFYALRTEMHDSNPESDEESEINSIEVAEDGWYTVSYTDMGWPGKTRIKIVDGKIDDYQRL